MEAGQDLLGAADRQVASTLAELILGGSLASVDLGVKQTDGSTGTAA